MLDLRVGAVRQSSCCAFEMYEKAGALWGGGGGRGLLEIMLVRP